MPTPFTRDQLSPAMQERYGLNQRSTGRTIAVTALVIAFVGALAFVTLGITRDQLDAQLLTSRSVSADRVDLELQVRRGADLPVTCVVRAQDVDRIDVGYATIEVPPGKDDVIVDYSLRVLGPAPYVELLGCAFSGTPKVPAPQFPPGVVPPEQPWS